MRIYDSARLAIAMLALLVVTTACNKGNETTSAAASDGKIPITTKSDEARMEFVQGRDMVERLLITDSVQHFDRALTLDSDFASAELARANASPTAKEFFEHLNKAVALADKTSDGERLQILAAKAGSDGDVVSQKADLDKLVEAYPNDERAHFALAGYYFGQQDLSEAVEHYKKATELNPNYSTAFNLLGYAYRQQGEYDKAEQAFKKYVELIPNDPNPYDSYAELLLKMGRFDESILQYRKALSVDPHFLASHFGIAANLMYQGKTQDAAAELQKMADQSRNDGELRTAIFGMAVLASDSGKLDKALDEMDKEYAVAEKKNDVASMAADLQAKGNILAQIPKYDAAQQAFDKSHELIQGSNLSQEIKDNSTLLHHFNSAAIAIGKKDYAGAKMHSDQFREGAEASKNPAQIKQAHELAGRLALAQKDYGKAIAELEQANLQNPANLLRLSEAYKGKGDKMQAQDYCKKAAEFNSLPQLNYAFVRTKAQKMAGGKA
jgi:tetratricopeptide (TPR) repeat protein